MKTERKLSRWGILMVGSTGPILAGCEGMEVRRTSTPLIRFDPFRLTGTTASGRPYRLIGESEPQYALAAFHSLWDAGDTNVRVVAPAEAVALIARQGNKPFERSAEEQAEIDQKRLVNLSGQMRMQLAAMELGPETAARRAGLSVDQIRGLFEADLARITADEADAAFVGLVGRAYGWIGDDPESDDEDAPRRGM